MRPFTPGRATHEFRNSGARQDGSGRPARKGRGTAAPGPAGPAHSDLYYGRAMPSRMMNRKAKAKLIILLGIIWVIITLPLPWIVNNPEVSESQFNTILGIVGVMSIPFVVLGVVWTLKPELTT